MAQSPKSNPQMLLGVDDAGSRVSVLDDPAALDAIRQMGIEFLVWHLYDSYTWKQIDHMHTRADALGMGLIWNQECTVRPRGGAEYERPGMFFQPPDEWVQRALASRSFLGVIYDEAEHWIQNGVWVTGGGREFQHHFYEGDERTIEQCFEGNLHNLRVMMARHYAALTRARKMRRQPRVAGEYVFPDLHHLFARAGIIPAPKYLKESVTPIVAASALGAAIQYGLPVWACLDLWGPQGYPSHSPEELWSSLLFAFWTGCELAFVENVNYKDSLYKPEGDSARLNAWGQTVRRFRHEFLPSARRPFEVQQFRPYTAIIRFPDSDWGIRDGQFRGRLYGASNLMAEPRTREWHAVWRTLTHGQLPHGGVNWNVGWREPHRFFMPAHGVAMFDHLVDNPALFNQTRLVFVCGLSVSAATLRLVTSLAERGVTVVISDHLAPPEVQPRLAGTLPCVIPQGRGRWIVTDDFEHPELTEQIRPLLGSPHEMTFRFGRRDVVFTAPEHVDRLEVTIR